MPSLPVAGPPAPGGLSRRAALGALGATGAAALSACTSVNDPIGNQRRRRREQAAGLGSSASTQPVDPDPDVAVAVALLARVSHSLERQEATVTTYPGVEDLLADLRRVEREHRDLLDRAVPGEATTGRGRGDPGPDPTGVPEDRSSALRALDQDLADLVLEHKQGAFAARSGAFARVLAGMAAGLAQQQTLLTGSLRTERDRDDGDRGRRGDR